MTAQASGLPVIVPPLERASEQLNPILVKEARQALKSRQFLITFSLLLACGWIWSLVGVALLSPGVFFAPGGRFMLAGYVLILIAPVLIVVPFSAFRSLAAEREDGTFELLSITTLGARQIVTGKLGSAVLQMLVYYSALGPCLAFTYLLRGIDIFTVLFILVTTFLVSILLSAVGLVAATAAQARYWQVILSVLLLIVLLAVTILWAILMVSLIVQGERIPYETGWFWQFSAAVVGFHITLVAVLVLAAAGQLSFASDNRATPLRRMLLVQQTLWVGWMTFAWLVSETDDLLYMFVVFPSAVWFLVGALMTGEQAQLSPRVMRSLPQSFLGRVFLTWFNPGSGTGYVFAAANLSALVAIAVVLALAGGLVAFPGAPRNPDWFAFATITLAYVVGYLGLGRLLVLLARRIIPVGVFVALLIHVGLAAAGAAVPLLSQAWFHGYSDLDYGLWQVTNWAWTMVTAAEGDLWLFPQVAMLVCVSAGGLFVVNLWYTSGEVMQVRQAKPRRVLEDDQ